MRTRLILAAVCILTLPLWFSASSGKRQNCLGPFATVAYAGHTVSGDWCQCGTGGCLCDPGEGGLSNRPVSDETEKPLDRDTSPIGAHSRSGSDFGTGALMLALAFFVWTRLRA